MQTRPFSIRNTYNMGTLKTLPVRTFFLGETLLSWFHFCRSPSPNEIFQLWRRKRAERKRAIVSRCSSLTCRDFPKWRACAQATSFLPVRSLILTGERWVVCDRIWKNNFCFSDVSGSTIGYPIDFTLHIHTTLTSFENNLSELKWTIFSKSFVSLSSNCRLWIIGFFYRFLCFSFIIFPRAKCRLSRNIKCYPQHKILLLLLLLPLQVHDKIV